MDKRISGMKKQLLALLILSILIYSFAHAQSKKSVKRAKPLPAAKDSSVIISKPLVTFVELGSVNCIPCKAMQPIMKSVEEKYGNQIRITFYDVWKEEQAHYTQDYNIRLIPTQVFLDANGKELIRHEGYFPEKEIEAFLQSKGLKPKSAIKE
jgi:thioredoxin 1